MGNERERKNEREGEIGGADESEETPGEGEAGSWEVKSRQEAVEQGANGRHIWLLDDQEHQNK